jgi:hypothetical protein
VSAPTATVGGNFWRPGAAPKTVHEHPNFVFPLPKGAAVPESKWTLDQGVDIAAPAHTPLLAVADGVIVRHGIQGFGADTPVLKITSGPQAGNFVYYGHAGPGNRLADGTVVKAGDVIGEVGAGRVGISTGPHLEIGFAGPSGNPIGSTTARIFKANLTGAITVGGGPGGVDVTKAPQKAVDAASSVAADAVKAVFGGFFDTVKKDAPSALLFLLLTVGGLALFGYGTARLFGVQQPVKSTVGAVRKAAAAGAVAGI